jgi:xylulose-5-phosphate/fructose-6-phosphate phosphoketolase
MLEFNAALSTAVESNDQSKQTKGLSSVAKPSGPLSAELLSKMHRYWYAANYLCLGQIYLLDNPLLREPLKKEHIKPRLLGHWGTSAGQNFIYVHLNRLIRETDAEIIYVSGPGHGGPTLNACAYLEGTYSDVHSEITQDTAGMRLLFRSF